MVKKLRGENNSYKLTLWTRYYLLVYIQAGSSNFNEGFSSQDPKKNTLEGS